ACSLRPSNPPKCRDQTAYPTSARPGNLSRSHTFGSYSHSERKLQLVRGIQDVLNFGFIFFAPFVTESTTSVADGLPGLLRRLITICCPKLTILPKNQYSNNPAGADHITHNIITGIK